MLLRTLWIPNKEENKMIGDPWNGDPTGTAYQLFMLSGNPGYYMLYSSLKSVEEEEEERERR